MNGGMRDGYWMANGAKMTFCILMGDADMRDMRMCGSLGNGRMETWHAGLKTMMLRLLNAWLE